MSSAKEGDWERRLPRDPEEVRQTRKLIAYLATPLLIWLLLTWLNETWESRIVKHIANLLTLTCLMLFSRTNYEKTLAEELRRLEPLRENPKDLPVGILYRYRGIELGEDSGFIGRRREGISFNGKQTSFIISPDIRIEQAQGDGELRYIPIRVAGEEEYELEIRPIGSYDLNQNDIVALKSLLMSDGEAAPSSTIHKKLPKVASPYVRNGAYFHPKLFYFCAVFIPLVFIGGYIWWAVNFSEESGQTVFVGVLLGILLLALLVIGVRDFWPTIARARQAIADLDARSG